MDSKALSSAIATFSAKFCIIRSSFSEVSSKLRSIKGVTLNVANRVYVPEGPYDLEPELKLDAVKVFDAAIEKIDFNTGAAATDVINQWVAKQTNHKIKDLISPGSVDDDTRLVLINALYFKGTWKKQFSRANTKDRPFHVTENSTVNVPMMNKEDHYLYCKSTYLEAQMLEMAYEGGQASMLIVLPYEIEGLDSVLSKLATGFDLISEADKMCKTEVEVTIPKFKIETEIDLTELLPKLGIKAIFNRKNSGLTKILNVEEPLFVSKAVQKAFIEVNEEGAQAAAATGIVETQLRGRPRFHADRPFLYVLFGSDHTMLFMGAYHGQPARNQGPDTAGYSLKGFLKGFKCFKKKH